jgi:hypothetical protein
MPKLNQTPVYRDGWCFMQLRMPEALHKRVLAFRSSQTIPPSFASALWFLVERGLAASKAEEQSR